MKPLIYLLPIVIFLCFSCSKGIDQNKNKVIVELIGSELNQTKIKSLATQFGASSPQLYQWKNHVAIYSYFSQLDGFVDELTKQFPKLKVKVYAQPFYNFSKAERCADTSVAQEWEHVLLTANLVEDEKLQQEYMHYHSLQFDEWPEVSNGFCNANFQQLLVYRNKRQLMIVISIPKGKTLEELNPKTIENNPRIIEWNNIMGKYQEGIEGTTNETWVFLTKVK